MCRALFTAGQLVSQLSAGFKGQPLVDGVLEAVHYIMQGVELAAGNPRQAHCTTSAAGLAGACTACDFPSF